MPVKTKVLAGVGVVLLLVLVWAWWPEPQPKLDPNLQKAAEAAKDPAANPPQTEYVPNPADGPRRKATKTK